MNIVMSIIIAWTFFVATDQVMISATTVGHTVENSEAILQNDDVIIIKSEEGIPIFVKFSNKLSPIQNTLANDKESPAT